MHEGPDDWKRSVCSDSAEAHYKPLPKDVSFYHLKVSEKHFIIRITAQFFHSASRSHHGYHQPLWVLSLHPSSPLRCSPNLPRLSWSAVLFELWRLPPIPHLPPLTFSVKTTLNQGLQLWALMAIGALCSCILMLCFLLLALYTLQKNLERGEARRTRPGTRACAVRHFISERTSILVHSSKKNRSDTLQPFHTEPLTHGIQQFDIKIKSNCDWHFT